MCLNQIQRKEFLILGKDKSNKQQNTKRMSTKGDRMHLSYIIISELVTTYFALTFKTSHHRKSERLKKYKQHQQVSINKIL